jgi:phosphoribosylamine-glycine ligase
VGHGPDLAAAARAASDAADLIEAPGLQRRHDIGVDEPAGPDRQDGADLTVAQGAVR